MCLQVIVFGITGLSTKRGILVLLKFQNQNVCVCFAVNFVSFLSRWVCLYNCVRKVPIRRSFVKGPLRKKCPNTEFFLVRIFLYLDWIQTRKNFVFERFSRSGHSQMALTHFIWLVFFYTPRRGVSKETSSIKWVKKLSEKYLWRNAFIKKVCCTEETTL